jgi:hypothetical protein
MAHVYRFDSNRPLLNIPEQDSIDTEFGNIGFLGNNNRLKIIELNENNNIYNVTCKVVDDISEIKIKVIAKKNVALFDKRSGIKIFFYKNKTYVSDFMPNHLDENRDPVCLVVENPKKVFNSSNNVANHNTVITMHMAEFEDRFISFSDCIVKDGPVRLTVDKSDTKYKNIDHEHIINYDDAITINVTFIY